MPLHRWLSLALLAGLTCVLAGTALAQQDRGTAMTPAGSAQPAPTLHGTAGQSGTSNVPSSPGSVKANDADQAPANAGAPPSKQQPKRILGVMPNYRAVSAGAMPPPPTPKQAFMIATHNSFDYSSFAFVGITSLMAEGTDAHPQLGKGVAGFGRYYWRGFVDKTDGNYMVIFLLPTLLHEDERYYAKGEGGIVSRLIYSTSRVLITPNYEGKNTFNAAEILGRGISQGVSLAYYPNSDRTAGKLAAKYGYAVCGMH